MSAGSAEDIATLVMSEKKMMDNLNSLAMSDTPRIETAMELGMHTREAARPDQGRLITSIIRASAAVSTSFPKRSVYLPTTSSILVSEGRQTCGCADLPGRAKRSCHPRERREDGK
jgi:hypothetical protein